MIVIEIASPHDGPDLATLGSQTFIDKFGHLYTAENLTTYLKDSHSPQWYADVLTSKDDRVWIARNEAGQAVGYGIAGANTLLPGSASPHAGEIKRLYVRQDQQGRGLGRQMLDVMLAWFEKREFTPLYLSVFSENLGAQRFYDSYGFHKVGEHIFFVGGHEDLDYIYRR